MHIKVGDTIRHVGWSPSAVPIKVIKIENNNIYYDTHEPSYKLDHCWDGMSEETGCYQYNDPGYWIIITPASNLKNTKEFVLWK